VSLGRIKFKDFQIFEYRMALRKCNILSHHITSDFRSLAVVLCDDKSGHKGSAENIVTCCSEDTDILLSVELLAFL
jgi:hypothetical protein